MSILAIAYAVVWGGIALFVARLAVSQRRLHDRLQALESQLAKTDGLDEREPIAA